MFHSIDAFLGYEIHATDGYLGSVHDVYFDSQSWRVRYIVADTGKWLPGRKVLLTMPHVKRPNHDVKEIPVDLTKEQVKESPPVSEDAPVSRLLESKLHRYYGIPYYWLSPAGTGQGPTMIPVGTAARAGAEGNAAEEEAMAAAETQTFLRSFREVRGYHLQATDGEFGYLDDLLVEDHAWDVRYLVVDARKWLPSKTVLIPPTWADHVDWAEKKVVLNEVRDMVERAPRFEKVAAIGREYEVELHEHYGRKTYW